MSRLPPAQLVHARVMHARLRPVLNRFVYPVFYLRLDLARLEQCQSLWFGVDRWRPLSLRRRDYGPRDGSDLQAWLRALLQQHGIQAPGPIWLQTFPRVFGHAFNPVSFWHCHDAEGRLCAVLAEVNNTFGEHHRYLLRLTVDGAELVARCDKQLHVSPFCRVEGGYRFRFRLDGAHPRTALDYHDADGLLIRTTLCGRAAPMTRRALAAALLRYPLLGLGIVARIHWQALRLWLRGVPFFFKPAPPASNLSVHEESPR